MNPSIISALAVSAGAIIGGLTSIRASLLTQRVQARAQWIAQDRMHRQDLYKEFIDVASKCYAHALQNKEPDVPAMAALYAKIERMRVVSSSTVTASAESIGQRILDVYIQPDKTLPELMEMASSKSIDVLGDFCQLCREEFESLRAQQP
jgi:hypothetical protein